MTLRTSVIALAGAAAAACAPAPPAAAPAHPVRVEAVAAVAAPDARRYSATLQPYAQVAVAFKVSGYVRELRLVSGRTLQAGDAVARGTVLARLDASDYQARAAQAKAQLAEADAGLVRARADEARAEALYAAQALTRPDYDGAVAGLASAVARADAARAQLEAAEIALRDTALVAPVDGVILSRSVEVGSLAGSGTVAFALADLTRVKAVFGVPDRSVAGVAIGETLRLTTEALGAEELRGTVTAISPAADSQSRVFGVEVTIPNPGGRLRAGMIAAVEMDGPRAGEVAEGSPTVAVAAVVRSARPGGYAVFVAEGDGEETTVRARHVSLGGIAGNRVAVETGLRVGERVVVSGASLLTDGDRVRIVPGGEGE